MNKRQKSNLIFASAAMVLFVGAIFLWTHLANSATPVVQNRPGAGQPLIDEPKRVVYGDKTYQKRESITTLLLMGIDTVESNEMRGVGGRNGGQADFLMLLVIDNREQRISMVDIDRDTLAEINVLGIFGNSAGTMEAQISLSHGYGDGRKQSCGFTVEAVSKLFGGEKIDFYAAMDLDGIPLLNDTLGGVTVTLSDDFSSMDPSMTPGNTLTLRGKQAEYFVRSRMSMADDTNAARMTRQSQYLSEVGKILDEKLKINVNFMGTLFDALEPILVTNMKRGRIINEAWADRHYERVDFSIPGTHGEDAQGFSVFSPDEEGLQALLMELFYKPL